MRASYLIDYINLKGACEVQFNVINFGRLSESVIAKGIKV